MKHSVSLLTLLLALPLLGCEVPSSQAREPAPGEAPLSVGIGTAELRPVKDHIVLTGTLKANREAWVAADATGKVLSVAVERGSRVRRGDVLAQIDRRQAALAAAEAGTSVASARTRSALAQAECERARRLYASKVIPQAEFDAAQAQCDDAAIGVESASVRREIAQKTLGDLAIRAPFDGVVAERPLNPGEYVRPDSRVVSLVQLDPLRLELSVPEAAVSSAALGTEVRFQVAAYPGQVFVGRVQFAGAALRPSTRDLLVEALVPNPDQRLRPGMFAAAEVTTGEVLLPAVPGTAIRSDAELATDRVFVVADGSIEERLVQLGPSLGDQVAIRSGLRAGERFVLAQSPELSDGRRVQ